MADREHPLLMRPELVLATLRGIKRQTRRLVTPGTSTVVGWKSARALWPQLDLANASPVVLRSPSGVQTPGLSVPLLGDPEDNVVVLPRVRLGDAVYIREPWQTGSALDDEAPSMLAAWAATAGLEPCGPIRYMADGGTRDAYLVAPGSRYGGHWGRTRPGIHLPRWASRLVLPVSSVRVERVCSISEEDALAEGVEPHIKTGLGSYWVFATLWDAINFDRAPWSADPWVWVYEWQPVGGQP